MDAAKLKTNPNILRWNQRHDSQNIRTCSPPQSTLAVCANASNNSATCCNLLHRTDDACVHFDLNRNPSSASSPSRCLAARFFFLVVRNTQQGNSAMMAEMRGTLANFLIFEEPSSRSPVPPWQCAAYISCARKFYCLVFVGLFHGAVGNSDCVRRKLFRFQPAQKLDVFGVHFQPSRCCLVAFTITIATKKRAHNLGWFH